VGSTSLRVAPVEVEAAPAAVSASPSLFGGRVEVVASLGGRLLLLLRIFCSKSRVSKAKPQKFALLEGPEIMDGGNPSSLNRDRSISVESDAAAGPAA
jgi:hypothetical protein